MDNLYIAKFNVNFINIVREGDYIMIRINNSKYLKNITRFIRQILYENLAVGVEIIHRGKTQLVSVAFGRQEADFVTENGGPIVLNENKGVIG